MSGERKKLSLVAGLVFSVSLTGCSSPPLHLYTLEGPATAIPLASGPLAPTAPVLEISRVSLPDYLDSQDLLIRDDHSLLRSPNGRWAERLSNGITDLITVRLSAARPDIFVTEQALAGSLITSRLRINITRLDIPASGQAVLDANWTYISGDDRIPTRTDRTHLTSEITSSRTDIDVVSTTNDLINQLSKVIADSLQQ